MAYKLLTAAIVTGRASTATNFDDTDKPYDKMQVQIDFDDSDTAITALTVDIETSQNYGTSVANATWFPVTSITLTAAELTANGAMRWVDGKIFRNAVANITTLTGGGSGNPINVTIDVTGRE
jgi:hypothetical protein